MEHMMESSQHIHFLPVLPCLSTSPPRNGP